MTQTDNKCVLEEASGLVNGDRARLYGKGDKECHRRYKMIAGVWGAMLDVEIPARVVPLMMAAMKNCRHVCTTDRDNLVDGAGYMGVAERVERYDEVLSVMDGAAEKFVPELGMTMNGSDVVGYHKISPTNRVLEPDNGATRAD